MITPTNRTSTQGPKDRDALQQSERKASESQPGSFSDDALTEKIVEVLPLAKDQAPIKGLDPKAQR